MVNVTVLEVLKPIDALIGFFEGDVQFRLELASIQLVVLIALLINFEL